MANSEPSTPTGTSAGSSPKPQRRVATTVVVVGFWRRFLAATVDMAIVVPLAGLLTFIAGRIAGIHLPPNDIGYTDVDMWFDLLLRGEPAIEMALGMIVAVAAVYLLVFQIAQGRTLGMRVMKIRLIDWYGEAPSAARCVARTVGYAAAAAIIGPTLDVLVTTLFPASHNLRIGYAIGTAAFVLGFAWIGFDSEKRGLHDLLARTYVVKA